MGFFWERSGKGVKGFRIGQMWFELMIVEEIEGNRSRAHGYAGTQESLEGRLLLFEGSTPPLLLLGLLLPQLLLLPDLLLEAAGCVHGVDLTRETLVNNSSSDV